MGIHYVAIFRQCRRCLGSEGDRVRAGGREIWAVDTSNGVPIWRNEVTTAAGMGQAVFDEVYGRLMVLFLYIPARR